MFIFPPSKSYAACEKFSTEVYASGCLQMNSPTLPGFSLYAMSSGNGITVGSVDERRASPLHAGVVNGGRVRFESVIVPRDDRTGGWAGLVEELRN